MVADMGRVSCAVAVACVAISIIHFRFFQKSDDNDFEQSKALFRHMYNTYALEVDKNNEEEIGQNTPSSSSGKSSSMQSFHDDSDEEDSTIESSNE
jgi:hypothetical protein